MTRPPFKPVVLFDASRRPHIVFARGRLKYRALAADQRHRIRLVALDSLRGLVSATLPNGEPYSVRRTASFWLNHSGRKITPRARAVLRRMVARRRAPETVPSPPPKRRADAMRGTT